MARRRDSESRRSSTGSFELTVAGRTLVFHTQPGVFSHCRLDDGSRLLLDTVLPQIRQHQTVLDLGAGVGVLGLSLAGLLSRGEVWLVDSDIRAVRLAEENMRLNGIENAHVVLGDITRDLPRRKFDLVVSNPPTHSGKEVLGAFVEESHDVLRPGGWLYLVVNRLLSVREMLLASFGAVEQASRHKGFLVLRAQKARANSRTLTV